MATTLTTAWSWAGIAVGMWTAGWFADRSGRFLTGSAVDILWYAVAVLSLCPFIAVLGAKRPGSRAWTGFVLIPMLLVLGWPAVAGWTSSAEADALTLEEPALVGYGLVLIMGIGNYLGTRFSLSALVIGVSLALLAAPLAPGVFETSPERDAARTYATLGLAAAVALACFRRSHSPSDPFDRLWNDFRNAFGIVWARRLQDRINLTAENERWAARLAPDGFHWMGKDSAPDTEEQTRQRIDHTLRWLFRRFADPAWIDARIQSTSWSAARRGTALTQGRRETEDCHP